jgi:hypothetical protein
MLFWAAGRSGSRAVQANRRSGWAIEYSEAAITAVVEPLIAIVLQKDAKAKNPRAVLDDCVLVHPQESFMPYREDLLKEHTHKDEGLSVDVRVFYTLIADSSNQHDRNTKLLSLLADAMVQAGIISEDRLDDMLLKVVGR